MILTTLVKKGGLSSLATATPATPATHETESTIAVATVATVAVADDREPITALSPDEESSIRAWLAHIGETGQATIDDLINRSRNEMPMRRYLLKRSKEVPNHFTFPRMITCRDCNHFERIDHPHLGHCCQGQPEAIVGLWDDDHRLFDHYSPSTKTEKTSDA